MATRAISPERPIFHARPAEPHRSTCQRAAQIAWNLFSIVVFPVGLTRLAAREIGKTLCQRILLPASLKHPSAVEYAKEHIFNDFLHDARLPLPFRVEPHTVVTPDGARLKAHLFRHNEGGLGTPTLVYFNPNGCVAYDCAYEAIVQKLVQQGMPFHFVAFDYRGTGESTGRLCCFNDLVVDAESVVSWVKGTLGTPNDKIHCYGYSLGGAVATALKIRHLELTGKLCSERSFSSTDAMITSIGRRIEARIPPDRKVIQAIFWGCIRAAKRISRWLGLEVNVARDFEKIQGGRLVIYHPEDPLIPWAASMAKEVAPEHTLRLGGCITPNDHCHPLGVYTNHATGRWVIDEIAQFLLPPEGRQ